MASCWLWERFWPSQSSLFAGTDMGEETAFVRKARQHKGKIATGVTGIGLGSVLALALPYFANQNEADVNQWKEISVLKQKIVVLETKVEFYMALKEKEKQ